MKITSTIRETGEQLAALRSYVQQMNSGFGGDLRPQLESFELEQALQGIIHATGGTVGLYFEDLSTGQIIEINSNELFPAAGVVKVLVMVHVLNLQVNLNTKIKLDLSLPQYNRQCQGVVDGSGMLNYLQSEVELSVGDLLLAMIVDGDNVAANVLLGIYGWPDVPRLFPDLRHTRMNSPIGSFDSLKNDSANPTTPAEIAAMFKAIHSKLPRGGSLMLDILSRQRNRSRIPFFLPDDPALAIAHKPGTLANVVHDAGIVMSPQRDYVLAILSKNQSSISRATLGIARLAEMIHKNTWGVFHD